MSKENAQMLMASLTRNVPFLRLNVSTALIVDAIIVDMGWETMQ